MNINMKKTVIFAIALLLLATVAIVPYTQAATNSITTNKNIYVSGENIHITVTGTPSVTYYVHYSAMLSRFNVSVPLNSAGYGYATVNITTDTNSSYTFDLFNNTGVYVANTTANVIPFTFEITPSIYTQSYSTYVPGDTIYTHIVGVPNTQYYVEVLNPKGGVAISPILVVTNSSGGGVTKVSIPQNISDGNGYNIIALSSLKEPIYQAGYSFNINSIEIKAYPDRNVYLVTDTVNIYYSVNYIKTGALVPSVANAGIWTIYLNKGATSIGSFSASQGTISINLAIFEKTGGISPNKHYNVEISYTLSSTPQQSADTTVGFFTGVLSGYVSVSSNTGYSPGSTVQINLESQISSIYAYSSNLPDTAISVLKLVEYYNWNYTPLADLSNLSLVTNIAGYAQTYYTLPTNIPIGATVYIYATFSKSGQYYNTSTSFLVQPSVSLTLITNQQVDPITYNTYLLSGSTLIATANFVAPTASVGTVISYTFKVGTGQQLLYYNSTQTNSISYRLPSNLNQMIYVRVTVETSLGFTYSTQNNINVVYGELVIQLSNYYYTKSGDTITAHVQLMSNVMTNPDYTYSVFDHNNNLILTQTSTATTFVFTVPSNPSNYYSIRVFALSGNYSAENSVYVYQTSGYSIQLSILSASAFTNNVFQPGETIIIHYVIIPLNTNVALPPVITLLYTLDFHTFIGSVQINTSHLQGNFSFTIPKSLTSNAVVFFVGGPENYALEIPIQSSPSWTMYNVLGMDLGTLVTLVLVIIALVIGSLALYKLRGSKGPKPVKPRRKKATSPKPYEGAEEKPPEEQKTEENL